MAAWSKKGEIIRDVLTIVAVAAIAFAIYGWPAWIKERRAFDRVCAYVQDARDNGNDDDRLFAAMTICERFSAEP